MKLTESNLRRLKFLIQKCNDKTLPRLKRYQANYLRLEMETRILSKILKAANLIPKPVNGGIFPKGGREVPVILDASESVIPTHEPTTLSPKYEGKADFITAKLESMFKHQNQ